MKNPKRILTKTENDIIKRLALVVAAYAYRVAIDELTKCFLSQSIKKTKEVK